MPRKVKIVWIVCCVILLFGFVYLSIRHEGEAMREAREKRRAEEQRMSAVLQAARQQHDENAELARKTKAIAEKSALGQYEEVVQLAQEVLKEKPNSAEVYMWWGSALVKLGRLDEALGRFSEAARLDPRLSKNLVYWGLALSMQGKGEEALRRFEEAVRSDPGNGNALAYWGVELVNMKRYDDAVGKLLEAININQFNATAYPALVSAYYRTGAYSKAWETVARARNVKVEIPADIIQTLSAAMPEPG